MAVYQFSALSDGQGISFDPSVDRLNFDQTAIAAGDLSLTMAGSSLRVAVKSGPQQGKDVVLVDTDLTQIATSNFTFADGSVALVGDNSPTNTNDHGPNTLIGGAGRDLLMGLGGNDNLQAGDNNDSLVGGLGNDSLGGNSGDDWLEGGDGNDVLGGGGGRDTFIFRENGAESADSLPDFASNWDRIELDAAGFGAIGATGRFASGDARFFAGTAAHDADDRIIFNSATGQLWYDADGNGAGAAQLIATLGAGRGVVATDFTVIETSTAGNVISGTSGNDTLVGTTGNDTINGFGGDDSLDGALGSDSLDGGAGNDYLFGGSDFDRTGEGADILVGGDGNDTLDGWSMSNTTPDPDIDTLDGGLGNDVFNVDNEADVLRDAGGTDLVQARTGDWTLAAGFENLILFDQEDGINDGIGNELDNVMESRAWEGELQGMGGNDLLTVYEFGGRTQILRGGDGNDTLLGSSDTTRTTLDGGAGDDSMVGGSATMTGGDGNDTLVGTSGIDLNDMTGGTGADRFVFASADNFTFLRDFASGSDRLVLDGNGFAAIGGSGDLAAGDERFYAAAGATAAHDATDRIIFNTSTGDLYYDADGTGSATAQRIAAVTGTLAATDITVINGTTSGGQTINGTAGNDSLLGGPGDDTINGFAGNDTIDGAAGADSMTGGTGNDLYFVDNSGDTVVELENAGIDEVRSSIDYTLADWVNNLTLTGDAHFGTGNAIDNVIVGTAQSNVLDGAAGADTMNGGLGDDDYHVDNVGDVLIDAGGLDGVFTEGVTSWTLAAGFEVLWMSNATPAQVSATGNDLDNWIRTDFTATSFVDAGAGSDTIYGSPGNDTIIAGLGNDTIRGDFGNDSIDGGDGNDTIDAGFGADTVMGGAGDDFVYGGRDGNDTLLGGAGSDTLYGGFGADSINGGDGNDTLGAAAEINEMGFAVGGGPQDAVDTLEGGLGNDTFLFARNGDILTDAGGIDMVISDVSWTLGAAFENLTLTGTSTTSGIGNTLANLISGSDGNNFLQAGAGMDTVLGGAGNDTIGGNEQNDRVEGGLGNDTVSGGSGQDSFVFREFGTTNADVLTDFASAWDGLQLDLAAFTAIGASGKFAAGDARFFSGAGATSGHDATDRVVYDTSTGNLYYDADGSGAGAAQLVATLQTHPALAATDIAVI
jgi:Ca2+-binding RTX toxin-like protein